jgi:hypothetical protein
VHCLPVPVCKQAQESDSDATEHHVAGHFIVFDPLLNAIAFHD